MHAKKATILLSVILIILLLGTTVLVAGPVHQEALPPLYLANISAAESVAAVDSPSALTVSGNAPGQRGYYIVQFRGPVEQVWKDEVAALGVEVLDYIPDFAFKVRMNPGQERKVAALDTVARRDLSARERAQPWPAAERARCVYRARGKRGAGYGQVRAAIATSGRGRFSARRTVSWWWLPTRPN